MQKSICFSQYNAGFPVLPTPFVMILRSTSRDKYPLSECRHDLPQVRQCYSCPYPQRFESPQLMPLMRNTAYKNGFPLPSIPDLMEAPKLIWSHYPTRGTAVLEFCLETAGGVTVPPGPSPEPDTDLSGRGLCCPPSLLVVRCILESSSG